MQWWETLGWQLQCRHLCAVALVCIIKTRKFQNLWTKQTWKIVCVNGHYSWLWYSLLISIINNFLFFPSQLHVFSKLALICLLQYLGCNVASNHCFVVFDCNISPAMSKSLIFTNFMSNCQEGNYRPCLGFLVLGIHQIVFLNYAIMWNLL